MKALSTTAIILYNLAVPIVFLGGAEFIARRVEYHTHGPNGPLPAMVRDRWTFFRNNPNFRTSGIEHNGQGFRRDSDVAVTKSANMIRIFVLGGSVTYGAESLYPEIENHSAPSNRQTIDFYLEQKLNAVFPQKHWEVINAGVKGYLLHQDLALLLSVILRYHPDYVISMDGVNDLSSLLRAPPNYDPYLQPELLPEFDRLANPRSFQSIQTFFVTWLRNDSVLFRGFQDWLRQTSGIRRREKAVRTRPAAPLGITGLAPDQQLQFNTSASQLDTYLTQIRQLHAMLSLHGIGELFALQPYLNLTRKQMAGNEERLRRYLQRVESPLFVLGLTALYPELSRRLSADAAKQGYGFLDLTNVFDAASSQTFTDYCHLTPEGNRIIADRFFAAIRDSLGPTRLQPARVTSRQFTRAGIATLESSASAHTVAGT
jgi:lysophospholipase L1-like esterase